MLSRFKSGPYHHFRRQQDDDRRMGRQDYSDLCTDIGSGSSMSSPWVIENSWSGEWRLSGVVVSVFRDARLSLRRVRERRGSCEGAVRGSLQKETGPVDVQEGG